MCSVYNLAPVAQLVRAWYLQHTIMQCYVYGGEIPPNVCVKEMPRSRVRDPSGASVSRTKYIELNSLQLSWQSVRLQQYVLSELEWSLVQFQVARLLVPMSEWSKEMDLSPIGRLSAQVRILLGTSLSQYLEKNYTN